MRSDSTLLEFSNRLFRQFLKIYPPQHHDRFNEEMAEDFRDLCEEVLRKQGIWGFLNLWLRVGLDLIKTAFEEQFKVRTNPTLEKMVTMGVLSALLSGVTWILLAFTHASPNWIRWAFHIKWIWFLLGSSNLLALLGYAAHQFIRNQAIKLGYWVSLLGVTFMTLTGILIPVDVKIWRLFAYGVDILGAGLLIQSINSLPSRSSKRWTAIQFTLGTFLLTCNQLIPARHMGLLFDWDATLFASLAGITWMIFGLALLHGREQNKDSY